MEGGLSLRRGEGVGVNTRLKWWIEDRRCFRHLPLFEFRNQFTDCGRQLDYLSIVSSLETTTGSPTVSH